MPLGSAHAMLEVRHYLPVAYDDLSWKNMRKCYSLKPQDPDLEYLVSSNVMWKKVKVGNDQEMAQSERNSHFKNRGGEKTKLTIRYLY